MEATRWIRAVVIATAAVALASAVPAAADSGRSNGTPGASAGAQHRVVLHRDGSIAVPFRGDSATTKSNEPVLRRDGSQAEAFVPGIGTPVRATGSDRFDWGDAAVGAASAFGLVLVACGGLILVRRSRRADIQPTVSANARTVATRG